MTVLGLAVRTFWMATWLVLAVLAVFAITRVVQPGDSQVVVGIAAVTPWPYLLAWPIATFSFATGRWVMAALAVAIVIAQIVLVLPTWWPEVSAAPPVGAWRLKIFDANVRYNNLDLSGIAREIESDRPEVVTLEELSDGNVGSLRRSGALANYPWHFIHLDPGSAGFGVWSNVQMDRPAVWYAGTHPEISTTLTPSSGPAIGLLVVHTFAPRGPGEPAAWSEELRQIVARVIEARKPLIAVGDFNATSDMKQFQALLHDLHDAAVERGQGWRMTWPRNTHLIPPLLRPDHLLYSDGLTATNYSLGHGSGSDHRPLLVELARAN